MGIDGAKHLLGMDGKGKRTKIKRLEDISKTQCESLYSGHHVETSKGTQVCLFVTDEKGAPVVADVENLGKGMVNVTPRGGETKKVKLE